MQARPYILAETTWKTVKDTDYQVAILPWGATEAHNYHLPYGTDVIESGYIAAEAARVAWNKGAKVVVLPTIPFGVNTGQFDIKLDINMNPSTQALVLHDVIESLSHQGIQKLVILNGHGGNDFKQMIRELQPQFPKVFLVTMNWYNKVLDEHKYFDEPGNHGGEMETSMMMNITPELVLPLSVAGKGVERKFNLKAMKEGWAWAQREWSKMTSDTGVGNPAKADVKKGKIFLDALSEKIGGFLVELAACSFDDLYE